MRVTIESTTVPTADGAPLGALVVAPADTSAAGPALLFYTDIFGRNPASVRTMMRFAGYGFTVVAPDLYRRIEPLGVALDFTADYDRAQRDAGATDVAAFDDDRRATLATMRGHPRVDAARIAAVGFCIGGHLALRAGSEPDVRAVVAYYPTGVHDGKLGASTGVDTLALLPAMRARLFAAFGALDPHVDAAGRDRIARAFEATAGGAERRIATYDASHAFMRDEGPRYDPEATDLAFAAGLDWLEPDARRSAV